MEPGNGERSGKMDRDLSGTTGTASPADGKDGKKETETKVPPSLREDGNLLRRFFLPRMKRLFFIRLGLLAAAAFFFFRFICQPVFIHGGSMMPTYPEEGFNFCWIPAIWFSEPKRGDVVILRYAGNRLMLLKRVVAFEGETVEFREGELYVNGKALEEPYVRYPCDWNRPPRTVGKGKIYVVGDNRSMPFSEHQFGQIEKKRLKGKPLW